MDFLYVFSCPEPSATYFLPFSFAELQPSASCRFPSLKPRSPTVLYSRELVLEDSGSRTSPPPPTPPSFFTPMTYSRIRPSSLVNLHALLELLSYILYLSLAAPSIDALRLETLNYSALHLDH